jgi:hypothetical protein
VKEKIVFILAFVMVMAGSAAAGDPELSGGGGGDRPLDLDPDRDTCWSQGPNLEGLLISSEVINSYDIESEFANDFLSSGGVVRRARWWGGYYYYVPGDPLVTSFNLRFYDDAGGTPGSILCEYVIPTNANESFLYDQGASPLYEYRDDDVCCPVVEGIPYWFVAQAGNHRYPPQWGRLAAAGGVQLSDAMFRCAAFGYWDWTPTVDFIGFAWDASQEFECTESCIVYPPALGACCIGDQGECRILTSSECSSQQGQYQGDETLCGPVNPCIPVASVPSPDEPGTKASSWGSIKGLYR